MVQVEITRKDLVERLKALLTDEFDAEQLVYETETELINRLFEVAEYYQNESNN